MTTDNKKESLIKAAVEVMQNSYSPYSKYKVGAAVEGGSGKIYMGTNVENASFGLTVCAERNAIFAAIANGEKEIKAVAIAAQPRDLKFDGGPCGACRQVITEFAKPAAPIYVAKLSGGKVAVVEEKTLADYYPYPFGPDDLNK